MFFLISEENVGVVTHKSCYELDNHTDLGLTTSYLQMLSQIPRGWMARLVMFSQISSQTL